MLRNNVPTMITLTTIVLCFPQTLIKSFNISKKYPLASYQESRKHADYEVAQQTLVQCSLPETLNPTPYMLVVKACIIKYLKYIQKDQRFFNENRFVFEFNFMTPVH